FWTISGISLLSLFCYREYARATGLVREKWVSFLIVVGMLLLTVATLDHWYRLFMALTSLTFTSIVAFAVLQDRPTGIYPTRGPGRVWLFAIWRRPGALSVPGQRHALQVAYSFRFSG